jgi:hypothetical protein
MKIIYSIFSIIIILTVLSFSTNIFSDDANMALYVIPPEYTATSGTASFTGPLTNSDRTIQFIIHDTLLNGMEGKQITSISWRLPTSATAPWPLVDVTYGYYKILLSNSVAPQDRSFTFAQNVVGNQTVVRNGPLTITDSSYTFGSNPNNFGPEITFNTPWLYSNGHLLIELRHTGFTGGTSRSVDALGTSVSGYGTLFSSIWTGDSIGTLGVQGNFSILRLNANPPVSINSENEIVEEYSLKQNYPNPFNPMTNIDIEMSKSGNATLKVYNAAGREVETIIENKMLAAGNSSYTFNASKLPSGIYFYSLFANGIKIDTKKMILIK